MSAIASTSLLYLGKTSQAEWQISSSVGLIAAGQEAEDYWGGCQGGERISGV